tara:strand:+ start:370 stop:1272 length:903 start_codon:yes stop_codon:yes gene_type:complete
MRTETVTLGEVIDRALLELESPAEAALEVLFAEDAPSSGSVVTLTVSNGDINVSDIVEWDSEMLLVTSVTGSVVTASRGYYGSPKTSHLSSTAARVNPQFSRHRMTEPIRRAPVRLEALGVPLIKSSAITRAANSERSASLPSDCRQVLRLYGFDKENLPFDVGGWRELEDLGLLMYPPLGEVTQMTVVYRTPFTWSTVPAFPDEAATIIIPEGASELLGLYAACWMLSGREVSRQEIDRSNEHQTQDQVRLQSGTGLVRSKWQEFYRSLDEVRRITAHAVPKHRPVDRRPRAYSGRMGV